VLDPVAGRSGKSNHVDVQSRWQTVIAATAFLCSGRDMILRTLLPDRITEAGRAAQRLDYPPLMTLDADIALPGGLKVKGLGNVAKNLRARAPIS
jgi:hypothetical protein